MNQHFEEPTEPPGEAVGKGDASSLHPWQAAAAHGCDMALLDEAIRRTPAERCAAHRSALALASRLRAAMERADAGS